MSVFQEQVAKILVRTVTPVHLGPTFYIFELKEEGQIITVSLNHKGWNCDYVESDDKFQARSERAKAREDRGFPDKWSCSFNQGKICRHILAVHKFMERLDLVK